MAMVILSGNIFVTLDRWDCVILVGLDFSNAFDTGDHKIQLQN